jgi:hypothetical protein
MSSKLGIDEVFTPGGVPSVTYVGRAHLKLEEQVENALKRKYSFIAIGGPTKCGKSVLCARVLRDQGTITVQGGQIASAERFWEHVAYYLNLPSTATKTRTKTWSWAGLPALEDAVVLAASLRRCTSAEAGLRDYEARRHHRANFVIRQSRRVGTMGQLTGSTSRP